MGLAAATGGIKGIEQIEVSSPVADGTYQNVAITTVTNTAKTSLNLTCTTLGGNAGAVAIRLNSTSQAQYKITNTTPGPPGFITFEVIEYY